MGLARWNILAHSDGVDEDFAAREVARAFGLPGADNFAALSLSLGMPLYWIGRVPITMNALARPSRKSELAQAVAKHRPRKMPDRHALVCVCPDQGAMVLSTWPSVPDLRLSCNAKAACGYEALFLNVQINGRSYTIETPKSFRHQRAWEFGKVANVTNDMPRPWTPSEADWLERTFRQELEIEELAWQLCRTPSEVLSQLRRSDLLD